MIMVVPSLALPRRRCHTNSRRWVCRSVNRCSHGHLACKFPLNVTMPSSPLETIGDKRLLGRFEELLDLSLREFLPEKQYDTYRPKVTSTTSDDELFDIMCQMLDPLDDGHVEL